MTYGCLVDTLFNLSIGLLVASKINALLVLSVSLGGQPSLGRFAVVHYSFHFLKMVPHEIFKARDIFCFVLHHNFIPDLVGELMMLFVW